MSEKIIIIGAGKLSISHAVEVLTAAGLSIEELAAGLACLPSGLGDFPIIVPIEKLPKMEIHTRAKLNALSDRLKIVKTPAPPKKKHPFAKFMDNKRTF